MTHAKKFQRLMTAMFILLFSSLTFAQSDTSVTERTSDDWRKNYIKPHMGLLAGFTNPDQDYDAAAEYGVDVGYQPYVPFGLGAELSSATTELDDGADLMRTKLLIKGSYNFGGTVPVIRDSYLGIGVGPMLETYGSSSEVAAGFLPYAGFDVPLVARGQAHDYLSLGVMARYLATTSGGPDAFSVNGALKYWF